MKIGIITLFPDAFPGALGCSIIKQGLIDNKWQLEIIDLRKYGRHIDDTPYGGGDGMIIKADRISLCIDEHINEYEQIIFTVPFGKTWNQHYVSDLNQSKSILFVCGRYEGIDYRIYDYYEKYHKALFFSIGDYIMCGGELPAMVMTESIIRTVLLRNSVITEESFSSTGTKIGMLESPQYTRPHIWRDIKVPDVLLCGDHKKIQEWRQQKSIEYTTKHRPDLL